MPGYDAAGHEAVRAHRGTASGFGKPSAGGDGPWRRAYVRGLRRNDLVEGLVPGNHAEVGTGALFEGVQARLEVADFGAELAIAFLELLILAVLRGNGLLQAFHLTYTISGEPNAVLEEDDDESQAHDKPFHGKESLSDRMRHAKWQVTFKRVLSVEIDRSGDARTRPPATLRRREARVQSQILTGKASRPA